MVSRASDSVAVEQRCERDLCRSGVAMHTYDVVGAGKGDAGIGAGLDYEPIGGNLW